MIFGAISVAGYLEVLNRIVLAPLYLAMDGQSDG